MPRGRPFGVNLREFSRSSRAVKGNGVEKVFLTLWLDGESSSTREQVEGWVLARNGPTLTVAVAGRLAESMGGDTVSLQKATGEGAFELALIQVAAEDCHTSVPPGWSSLMRPGPAPREDAWARLKQRVGGGAPAWSMPGR